MVSSINDLSLKNTQESLCFKLKAYLGTKELDAEMGNMIEALHEVEADFDNVYGEHDSRELRTPWGFRVPRPQTLDPKP